MGYKKGMNTRRWAMSGIQGRPFRGILLAVTISTLLACSTLSADIKTLRKQATAGDVDTQYNLGVMYANGQGVPQDYAEAIKWYRKAAEQENARAQYNLGGMYDKGQGVPQDYAESAKWYRKAAGQRLADAQYNLGVMYDKGQGVPQDHAEAVKWFYKAAEQGHTSAQYNLGVSYYNGNGVPQDYVQTYFWFSLAASGSTGEQNKEFSASRNDAAKKLTPENLMEAQRMTTEWEKSHPRK